MRQTWTYSQSIAETNGDSLWEFFCQVGHQSKRDLRKVRRQWKFTSSPVSSVQVDFPFTLLTAMGYHLYLPRGLHSGCKSKQFKFPFISTNKNFLHISCLFSDKFELFSLLLSVLKFFFFLCLQLFQIMAILLIWKILDLEFFCSLFT